MYLQVEITKCSPTVFHFLQIYHECKELLIETDYFEIIYPVQGTANYPKPACSYPIQMIQMSALPRTWEFNILSLYIQLIVTSNFSSKSLFKSHETETTRTLQQNKHTKTQKQNTS